MPPKPKIVRSGNAGNSKSAKEPEKPQLPDGERRLFPPGSKTPLNLLHERCQKNGWNKPIVETWQRPDGWCFKVLLSRTSKSQTESVSFTPHPPFFCPSSLEARHWGATYALYRFCNKLQLNHVLPPGPREYWRQLSEDHKNIPDHQKWMYDSDPFAAQREVAARQETKAASAATTIKHTGPLPNEYSQAAEVRMAQPLRDLTEEAIKKELALYPETSQIDDLTPNPFQDKDLRATELMRLGFTSKQSQKAVDFLASESQSLFASVLLRTLSPLEACIEYLVLHTPECDLPQRFLPEFSSSTPLISSLHSGSDDLKQRWMAEKAQKEAGWPTAVIKSCFAEQPIGHDLHLLTVLLGKKLLGQDASNVKPSTPFIISPDEYEPLGAVFEEPDHLVMPLVCAPLSLHILVSPDGSYPRPGFCPIYMTSPSVASYVRLHILSCLLTAIDDGQFLQPGEGFCMAAMRIIEEAWAVVEDNGPPDFASVMKYLIAPSISVTEQSVPARERGASPNKQSARPRPEHSRRDRQTSEQLKHDFELLQHNEGYVHMFSQRKRLPAFSAEAEFIRLVEKHQVVIVVGETGCGKTTQCIRFYPLQLHMLKVALVPQFILDSLLLSNRGSDASIIVTQPRRLSAVSVAARVATERHNDGSVAYAIRGESTRDHKTKLLFATTGIILRRLASGDRLENISHIFIDEVHERSVDSDFLLLELKELLAKGSKLRIILMSATINHEIFVNYFGGAPLLSIPGFTYPVTDRYLEDIIPEINYQPSKPQSTKTPKIQHDLDGEDASALQAVVNSSSIDYQLIATLVAHIISTCAEPSGILIFLPGVQEIRRCIESVRAVVSMDDAIVLPLHANLSVEEQRKVFSAVTPPKWKVIASTNVAETSITIDDVVYVVDTGKVKEMSFDAESNISRLVEIQCTQAQARQRRGRAGRVRSGKCFKLYTRSQEVAMQRFPVPEILRVPLHSLLLTVKNVQPQIDAKTYLHRAIDPPEVRAMESSWRMLEDIEAVDFSGDLTALGRYMALLPLDVRLAKMLILGTIFRCMDPILTVVAVLSSRPLFVNPVDQRDEVNRARIRLAKGSDSDLLGDQQAYDACTRLKSMSSSVLRKFCEANFLSFAAIQEVAVLRREFFDLLVEMNFVSFSSHPTSPHLNTNSTNTNLLKSVILGGLYPQMAMVKLPNSAIKFDKVQGGTVQRDNAAKEFRFYDVASNERVFLHPASVLFAESAWKQRFVAYFQKHMTTKLFLRGVTQVPLYGVLLFAGEVSVNHVAGGLTVGRRCPIKLKAWPRIGILVNQLRRLLDAQLLRCLDEGYMLDRDNNPILQAMLALLTNDGM